MTARTAAAGLVRRLAVAGLVLLAACTTQKPAASAGPAAMPADAAATPWRVPSLDQRDGRPVPLPAFWFPRAGSGRAPALLLLHGCGGPYDHRGRLSARMREYAALLNGQGFHVLVTDSLTPRGETELCTQRLRDRQVTPLHRRRDALGALQWLAARPEVDPTRLGLMGWSHGASTVLASLQRGDAEVAAAPVQPAFAIAYYPGCGDALRQGWQPNAPLLMLLGAADDWTPAAPCQALAARVGAPVEVEVYPGAHHGFDGTAPVRLRPEVPTGVNPGQGVHVGGDPAARAASHDRLRRFLREQAASR